MELYLNKYGAFPENKETLIRFCNSKDGDHTIAKLDLNFIIKNDSLFLYDKWDKKDDQLNKEIEEINYFNYLFASGDFIISRCNIIDLLKESQAIVFYDSDNKLIFIENYQEVKKGLDTAKANYYNKTKDLSFISQDSFEEVPYMEIVFNKSGEADIYYGVEDEKNIKFKSVFDKELINFIDKCIDSSTSKKILIPYMGWRFRRKLE